MGCVGVRVYVPPSSSHVSSTPTLASLNTQPHTRSHIHTHTHMHTHAHKHTQTTHTNTHKHTQTHTNTHTQANTRTYKQTHTHTHTYTGVRVVHLVRDPISLILSGIEHALSAPKSEAWAHQSSFRFCNDEDYLGAARAWVLKYDIFPGGYGQQAEGERVNMIDLVVCLLGCGEVGGDTVYVRTCVCVCV